jgi:hypothetical protein
MRDLKRNQSTVYYSLCIPKSARDKNGNLISSYSEPVSGKFSLSVTKGTAENEPFGREVDYDREMTTHNMNCAIDEHSRLWIGISTDKPYNYIVKKVAKSLNCIRYAIKEVKND